MRTSVLAVFVGLAVACGEPRTPVVDVGDAQPQDGHAYSACARACANLRMMGCPEGDKMAGGDPCEAVCDRAEATGKFTLKPSCVATAHSPEEVRACGTVRCPGR